MAFNVSEYARSPALLRIDSPDMRITASILVVSLATAAAEPVVLKLTPKPEKRDSLQEYTPDYGGQLIEKFNALRQSDENIRRQFEAFEARTKEWSGGRYQGAAATPLILHQEMGVDFSGKGGLESYDQTVVIHYSFQGGVRRGLIADKGVFAVFSLNETISYTMDREERFHQSKRTVQATFEGFRKVLHADKADAEPAEVTAPEEAGESSGSNAPPADR